MTPDTSIGNAPDLTHDLKVDLLGKFQIQTEDLDPEKLEEVFLAKFTTMEGASAMSNMINERFPASNYPTEESLPPGVLDLFERSWNTMQTLSKKIMEETG